MLLSLFRTNQIAINIFLLLYTILLRLSVFIVPITMDHPQGGIMAEWIYGVVGTTGVLPNIIACLLVFIQAFMINILIAKNRMVSPPNLLPGLFYVLLMSAFPDFLGLSPLLIANTFYILAFLSLFNTYKKYTCADTIFNVGFFLGLGSLCYFSSVIFLLMALVGINSLRASSIKEVLMLTVGFLTPFFLSGVYYYVTDGLPYFYETQFPKEFSFLNFEAISNWETYIKLGLFALLLLIAIFGYNKYTSKKEIHVQKKIGILYWGLMFGGFSLFLQVPITIQHLMIIVLPLGIFLAFRFLSIKNNIAEAFHYVLLFTVLILHYRYFWLAG